MPHPLRKLTEQEDREEMIYRRQLRDKWGWQPGDRPEKSREKIHE